MVNVSTSKLTITYFSPPKLCFSTALSYRYEPRIENLRVNCLSRSKTRLCPSESIKSVSAKPAMKAPDRKSNIDFIPFVHPQDSKGKRAVKQQIRFHVTRFQHERSGRNHHSHQIQPWSLTSSLSASTYGSPQSYQSFNLSGEEKDGDSYEAADTSQHGQARLPDFNSLPLLPPSPIGSTEEDPFWTYPIPYSPLSSRMIAHYVQCLTLPVPELDGPQGQGLLRSYWFPLAMRCPATLYAVLLMAASHYRLECKAASISPWISEKDILFLKGCALHEVNRSFRSRVMGSSVSDAMIGAVAKLAVFEALFGDVQMFRRHMAGLSEMIALRQNLGAAMGTLDAFVRRLVFWIDLNASHLTGIPRTFSGKKHMLTIETQIKEPNPISFAGTARALEALRPTEIL